MPEEGLDPSASWTPRLTSSADLLFPDPALCDIAALEAALPFARDPSFDDPWPASNATSDRVRFECLRGLSEAGVVSVSGAFRFRLADESRVSCDSVVLGVGECCSGV